MVVGIVGNPSLAEEVMQKSFVRAAMRIDQLREGGAFFGWLVSIARSIAVDEIRAENRRGWVSIEESDSFEAVTVDASDVKEAVHLTLQQLEPDERTILVLGELEGLTMEELSTALQISQSAAKMRLKRARDRFRRAYEKIP